ncbi:PTI1-like tyrosine-protein kinase [Platanthera guangdongensis]|uniref:PTI1-like tyrosine-protein kinase n=1 Tax=Platanthera guangdongensis TaxID=2320717 RepID=A0ABR2M6K3_9ASPA
MEFAVEVEILRRVRHKNLLALRGYCVSMNQRLIVYDYMPNLSLLSHLHGQFASEMQLDWKKRMNVIVMKLGPDPRLRWFFADLATVDYLSNKMTSKKLNPK